MAGVFVDGAFIKSVAGSIERATDALSYLSPEKPQGILPLCYLGVVQNVDAAEGEVIDYWLCHGAIVLHLRAAGEQIWDAYAGGDPRRGSKRSRAGRVLISFTSAEPYWICVALGSIKAHFSKAERYVTNLELPKNSTVFRELDPNNEAHKDDLRIVEDFERIRERNEGIRGQLCVALDPEGRFLAKLALGIGYNLFGQYFLETSYGKELRTAFREADREKRCDLSVRGSGYWDGVPSLPSWSGGWLLTLLALSDRLALMVTTPSGRTMTVQVADDSELLGRLGPEYQTGLTWVVVPPAQRAVGPVSCPDYLAHLTGQRRNPDLQLLDDLRGDLSLLPSVR